MGLETEVEMLIARRRSAVVLSLGVFLLFSLISPTWAQRVERTLSNGLRVVVVEDPASPTVSVNLFIAAGSLDETPEISGLAHFFEHLFFRGTPTLGGLAFKKAIESLGGATNATTAKDMTHFFINLPAEHAERGLELLVDALLNASCEPDGIRIERDVVLEEYRLGQHNVGRLAGDELYKLAYGTHPYGRSTIGTEETLKRLERADFIRWRNRNYKPSRCTVVVVGDVPAQAIQAKARLLLENWNPSGVPERALTPPPPLPTEPVVKEGVGPVHAPVYFVGFPAPAVSDPSVPAVDVLSFLLGQGKKSLLWRHLVDEQKLAEQVDVSYLTPLQRGLMVVTIESASKKTAALQSALQKELKDVIAGTFTDEDLHRAKEQLIGTFLLQNESPSGLADSIGFYSALGQPEFSKTYVNQVMKVDRSAVLAAAQATMGGGYWAYVMKPKGSSSP